MKKVFLIIMILILTLCSCNSVSNYLINKRNALDKNDTKASKEISVVKNESNDKKLNYDNIKGVWISYLEYGQIMTNKTEAEFTQNITQIYDNLITKGYNTVIVQARSHSDAYYNSEIYPYSKYITGEVGKTPNYDPLKIMVKQAHNKNLSVHAWINPYRVMSDDDLNLVDDKYTIKKWYKDNQNLMVKHQDIWYLNPQNVDVQNLIASGVEEICKNYDVDGIQIDDYFFVPPIETFNCDAGKAKSSTTALVKKLYDTIKSAHKNILFGVSPAGNYTDKPKSDTTQYTDLETWCQNEGYIDYVAPQIYWAFDDKIAPFEQVLKKWSNLCKDKKVKLVIGLAGYKFANSDELNKQIDYVNNNKDLFGYIVFRYDNIK